MYKLKVTCKCGAFLELEFDNNINISIMGLYKNFIQAHINCVYEKIKIEDF
ncbi:MAG: hypothetical protein ACOCP4_01960 [Candidatus Woesearchaeota archaeon]